MSESIVDLLDEAAKKLAKRIAQPEENDPMSVTEVTGAVRALTAYVAVKHKIDPIDDSSEGALDEYAQQIESTRAGGGGNRRSRTDGSCIPPDF